MGAARRDSRLSSSVSARNPGPNGARRPHLTYRRRESDVWTSREVLSSAIEPTCEQDTLLGSDQRASCFGAACLCAPLPSVSRIRVGVSLGGASAVSSSASQVASEVRSSAGRGCSVWAGRERVRAVSVQVGGQEHTALCRLQVAGTSSVLRTSVSSR